MRLPSHCAAKRPVRLCRLLFKDPDFNNGGFSFEADTSLERASSCPFATRCQYADGECKKSLPPLRIFEEGTGKGASMSGLMTGPGFAVFELTSRRCRC